MDISLAFDEDEAMLQSNPIALEELDSTNDICFYPYQYYMGHSLRGFVVMIKDL